VQQGRVPGQWQASEASASETYLPRNTCLGHFTHWVPTVEHIVSMWPISGIQEGQGDPVLKREAG